MKQLLGKVTINEKWKKTKSGPKYANGFIGGYPGLTLTAKRIAEYIPYCKLFVEPFAGLGRISKKVHADKKILNDMSDFAFNHNSKKFKNCVVTHEDFKDCVLRWDSKDTFFFFDPPWRFMQYDPNHTLAYCDRTVKQYYEDLFSLVPTLKGDWIIAGEVHEKESGRLMQNSGYPNIIITLFICRSLVLRVQSSVAAQNAINFPKNNSYLVTQVAVHPSEIGHDWEKPRSRADEAHREKLRAGSPRNNTIPSASHIQTTTLREYK